MSRVLFITILFISTMGCADWLNQLEGSNLQAAREVLMRDIVGLKFSADEASERITFSEGKAVEPINYDQPTYDYLFQVEVDFPPYQLEGVCRIVYDSFQMPVAIFNKEESKCEEFEKVFDAE